MEQLNLFNFQERKEKKEKEEKQKKEILGDNEDIREFHWKIKEILVSPFLVVDTETTGLNPFKDSIRLLQVKTENDIYVFDLFELAESKKEHLVNILLNHTKLKIMHNAVFDLSFLSQIAPIKNQMKIFDTSVAGKILDCGLSIKGFSLEDLIEKYLKIEMDKQLQKSDWSGNLTIEQLEYAKNDVEMTYMLYEELQKELEKQNLMQPFLIDCNSIQAITQCFLDGIYLDLDDWNVIVENLEVEYKILKNKIEAILNGTINLNSPIQIKTMLEKLLGFSIPTTGKDYLETIKNKHKIIPLLIEFKIISKKLTSFGKKYEKYLESDSRLHPKYSLIGTATGRMSCSNPNIQQIPREQQYRQCFKAGEGNVLIKADYSQIELRIVAHLSQDPIMLKAYKNNEDLHILSASRLLNVPISEVTKEQRYQAKSFNFGFLYSMGAKSFQQYARINFGLDISLGKAEVFKRKFFETYVGIKMWHKSLERKNFSITLGGRKRLYNKDYYTGELYNTPVQGTGADILKKALFYIYNNLVLSDFYNVKLVAIVHDEIVVECKEEDSVKVEKMLKQFMMRAWDDFIGDVGIEVETKIGKSWGG